DRPTALMVATDRNAIGFMDRLCRAGLTVPRDVAVVAVDNIEAAAYTQPPLTTVDQPFDELGALAARLVLDELRGIDVPPVPHRAAAAVVVRGSCGCVPRTAEHDVAMERDHHEQDEQSPASGEHAQRETRREMIARLSRPLLSGDDAADERVLADLDVLMDDIARLTATGTASDVTELTASLRRLAPRPGALRKVAREVHQLVRRTATPAALEAFRDVLWHMEASAFLGQSTSFEQRLDEQFGVDAGLLDADGADPELLGWLQGTHVRAGVLGLWSGRTATGDLRITGSYDPEGLLGRDLPGRLAPESFPPAELVAAADPSDQQVCYVVPVRTRERDWGLLAVTAEIETMSARETYHHWAALLAAALEERSLQAAVQASEERYSLAARAAKDGLWEWDAATGQVFVSDRCGDLLGLDRGATVDSAFWASLVHPDDLDRVGAAMAEAMAEPGTPVEVEYRAGRFTDTPHWVLSRCLGVGRQGGSVERLVGSLSDIQTRKELEEQLRQAALYDTVTGLPNRRLFLDRLTAAVREPSRRENTRYAVIFLDLDGFKLINDSLGHLVGDQLLAVVADRLRSELRTVDTAARFGGDEFALLLVDPIPDEVLVIAQRIQERLAQPVLLGGHEVSVTASVGIATSETGYSEAADVLRDADTAMYHAKATERGTASVFDPEMHMRATGRLKARGELRTALAEHQFVVHYQPIVALDGSGVGAFEALVRWQHPEQGLLLPGAFLPAMEDNATIVTLGQWLVQDVCRQIAVWRADFDGPVAVSVNLSHREFWSTELVGTIARALAGHAVPPECLVLEITESVIMADPAAAREVMTALHAMGIKLHVDDFGTGQSSLNALRTLPVDALKIDGSFIRELVATERTRELVGVILYMGKVLGLDVIAECVETPEQADRLQAMGCANAQGWLYGKALPGDEAGRFLGTPLGGSATGTPTGPPEHADPADRADVHVTVAG
ncbi:MAG: Sensory box/GGDEF family protein, partial [Actinotalea sp.]|nr:Sensory box/GGDEF family protein [Actinotalea sp.]